MQFTTELSAVNSIIGTIGEAPVNTLVDSGMADVVTALEALREVTRQVLVVGWSFNTDVNYPLYPTALPPHNVGVPVNALSVIPEDRRYVARGSRLYDAKERTYSFSAGTPIPSTIKWYQDFSELPEVTRQYITIRSARLFQARVAHSQTIRVFTETDETQARLAHERENILARRGRMIMKDNTTAAILER